MQREKKENGGAFENYNSEYAYGVLL